MKNKNIYVTRGHIVSASRLSYPGSTAHALSQPGPWSWFSCKGALTSCSQSSGWQKASARTSRKLCSGQSELKVSLAKIFQTRARRSQPTFCQRRGRSSSGPTSYWRNTLPSKCLLLRAGESPCFEGVVTEGLFCLSGRLQTYKLRRCVCSDSKAGENSQ